VRALVSDERRCRWPCRDENVCVEVSGPVAFSGMLTGRRDDPLRRIQRDKAAPAWNALLAGERC
jgi:hypothetical protein